MFLKQGAKLIEYEVIKLLGQSIDVILCILMDNTEQMTVMCGPKTI